MRKPFSRDTSAWHLGNRHLTAEITRETIRIRADHVIAEMVIGLGAEVCAITAPFNPERGAYGGHAATHSHDHAHGHSHEHSQHHAPLLASGDHRHG